MIESTNDDTKIIFDADVLRHFFEVGYQHYLTKIFPDRIVISKIVKSEVQNVDRFYLDIRNFIRRYNIEVISIDDYPDNFKIQKEFAILTKKIDRGEAECLAIAKFDSKYVASSNISQIEDYCNKNNIKLYKTLDILCLGIINGVMTEHECDNLIQLNRSRNNKLPNLTIAEYCATIQDSNPDNSSP